MRSCDKQVEGCRKGSSFSGLECFLTHYETDLFTSGMWNESQGWLVRPSIIQLGRVVSCVTKCTKKGVFFLVWSAFWLIMKQIFSYPGCEWHHSCDWCGPHSSRVLGLSQQRCKLWRWSGLWCAFWHSMKQIFSQLGYKRHHRCDCSRIKIS